MNLETIKYNNYEKEAPQKGRYILSQVKEDSLIVYQAFNPNIAKYAVEHQQFGGPHYKFSRMSWIKPNFLWMMYRCGWAAKEEQKHVLAIEISKVHFEEILSKAVASSFNASRFSDREAWQESVANSDVRLQWDPDHNPYGAKLERRAIQLGLRGEILEQFGKEWIISIQDITDFVKEEGAKVLAKNLDDLNVVKESVFVPSEGRIVDNLRLDSL